MSKMKDGLIQRGKTWAYVVSTADPVTGHKKPVWHGGFASQKDAKVARDEARDQANKGLTIAASRQKLCDYLDEWLEIVAADLQPTTVASYRQHVRIYFKPLLGEVRLCDITPRRLKAFYSELAKAPRHKGEGTLSPRTVDRIRATLRSALSEAVADGLLSVNAAATRRKKRGRKPKTQGRKEAPKVAVWSSGEVATFLESIDGDRLQALWRLAVMTGMRRAELSGLRWKDVDLKAGVVEVRHTLTAVYHEPQEGVARPLRGQAVTLVDGEPKSGEARLVDIDEETCQALTRHKAAQAGEKLAFPGSPFNAARLVFVAEDGLPLHPDWVSRRFRKLESGTDLTQIRLHDLRHTHASQLLAAGVPVHVVSQRLGHKDPGFTLRVYAHFLPRQQRDAAERVAGLVANAAHGSD